MQSKIVTITDIDNSTWKPYTFERGVVEAVVVGEAMEGIKVSLDGGTNYFVMLRAIKSGALEQTVEFTPANVEVDDIFSITINDSVFAFIATAATVANVTAGLVALINAGTEPVAATDNTTKLTVVADTPGKEFTYATSAVDGGSGTDNQTLVSSETQSPSEEFNFQDRFPLYVRDEPAEVSFQSVATAGNTIKLIVVKEA